MMINKTEKLFINGAYCRSESGCVYSSGAKNFPLASAKDLRNAVDGARLAKWPEVSPYNRGQIIYRIAEMLSGRQQEFANYLTDCKDADRQIALCLDRIIYLAGWADKYQQLLSNINPVNGPYLSVSQAEAIGVVAIIADDRDPLLSFLTQVLTAIVVGNTAVVCFDKHPAARLAFGEIFQSADVPPGVINLLSGNNFKLQAVIASHREIKAIVGLDQQFLGSATDSLKRIISSGKHHPGESASINDLAAFTETKTIWHPRSY